MYRLNTKIPLTMLCFSGFELYSRWVPPEERQTCKSSFFNWALTQKKESNCWTCRDASVTRKATKMLLLLLLFYESRQRKKPNTVYDDTRRPQGSAFRKTGLGCCSDDFFFRKNRANFLIKNSNVEMIGPWVITAILDVSSAVRAHYQFQ